MNDSEVNKTIAEFMGYKYQAKWIYNSERKVVFNMPDYYSKSIDVLVPVIDKLFSHTKYMVDYFEFAKLRDGSGYAAWFEIEMEDCEQVYYAKGETVQQAVAYSVAKAILGAKNDKES